MPAAMIALDRLRAGVDRREVEQHRAHVGRRLREAHADLRGDAEHPLAADERPAQVVAVRLGILAAEHDDRTVGQDDLDGQHVRLGDPVGQAVRPTGVVGHVAADAAALLAARVGGEVQTEAGDVAGQVEVEHARLDPRHAVHRVDRQHPVHLRRRDHHPAVERRRPTGETGPRTAGDERHVRGDGEADAGGDLLGRQREADDAGAALDVRRVALVQAELGRPGVHPVRRQRGAQPGDQRLVDLCPRAVAGSSGAIVAASLIGAPAPARARR